MPKGNPNAQTLATERYQKKAGYVHKTFKLKGDVVERFVVACTNKGVSQASVITEAMERFISDSGKETVNLIEKLEQKGMSAEEIIEIIKYVETHQPENN